MSMTVPEVILVGQKTRYRHFARGPRDLYAPEEMLPDPPPQHVWSYCVSREHNNTVYFHNDASGRSLWVLPSLASDGTEAGGGAEEVMRTVGSVESASAAQKHVKFGTTDEKSHEAAAVRRAVMRQSIEKAMSQAETQKPTETVQKKTPTGSVAEILNNENSDGNGKVSASPVRERLAVWRAKRAQQQQQKEHGGNDPVTSSYGEAEGSRVNHGCPAFSGPNTATTKMTSSLDNKIPSQISECVAASKGSEFKKGGQPAKEVGNLEESVQCQQEKQHNSLERDVYDERRRLFLEAHEELQREKAAALQKERLALEQVARLQEAQRREEEERTRLAAERKRLEQQRLELQKRVLERQRELLAKVEEEAMQRELAAQLDNFFENKSRLEQQAQEERQRVLSFEDAIAESLLGKAVKNHTTAPKEERIIDLRLLEESDEDTEKEDNNNNNNRHGVSGREETCKSRNSKERQDFLQQKRQKEQKQQRRERITYSPSLVYVGDVTGGGCKTPVFLQRQGRGTLFYDTAQKHFFDGEWSGDKRNGSGALSLPHVAVEGTWRDDVLEGSATFQTRRLKGKGEFKQGVLDGNAVVEIDCNGVFAGSVKKNGTVVASGAVTLASGDHVEWIRDENSNENNNNNNNRQQTSAHSKKFNNGSGRCRIRFENGDVYVGEVENYQPNGAGTYRFAAEGQEYVGNFQNGRLQGRGTYRFANGNVYIGQFYKGLFHGEGRYVEQDAYTYEGFWEYGTAHGRGKLIFANGDVWEGEFDHDRRVNGHYTASRLFQL
ncbi:hypothetical protein TcYC6_0016530 [Trypanosoma cruzi]|nr:hypothetical protein TcYC6_0016530 [Trypanosoma cruzi]